MYSSSCTSQYPTSINSIQHPIPSTTWYRHARIQNMLRRTVHDFHAPPRVVPSVLACDYKQHRRFMSTENSYDTRHHVPGIRCQHALGFEGACCAAGWLPLYHYSITPTTTQRRRPLLFVADGARSCFCSIISYQVHMYQVCTYVGSNDFPGKAPSLRGLLRFQEHATLRSWTNSPNRVTRRANEIPSIEFVFFSFLSNLN